MISIGDIIRILDWLGGLLIRFEELQAKQEHRRKVKDEIFRALMMVIDFVVDGWSEMRVEKELEGGYQEEVYEIEDLIDELRSLLAEAYRAAQVDDPERTRDKLEQFERQRRKLIRLVRRLKRKQWDALRERLEEARRRRLGSAKK